MMGFPWGVVFAILFFFFVFGGIQAVTKLIEGRRTFLLDMRKEETRIAEAKAKELEIQQKRAELEYREALLELERFDRRAGDDLRPRLSPPADPLGPSDPAEPADPGEPPVPPGSAPA